MTLIHYRNPIDYKGNGNNLRTFDELIDDLMGTGNHLRHRSCNPSANIYESEKEFRIEMAVPGLSRDQIRITLDDDVLKLSSSSFSEENKEENHHRSEFDYSNFERSFIIPDIIEREKIAARYNGGILYVHLPKREDKIKRGPKDIKIK